MFEALRSLVVACALTLTSLETKFAIDPSGFSGSRFDRWYDHKHGQHRIRRSWVKAHCMVGVLTDVVTAVEIHDQNAGDVTQLPALLNTTAVGFKMEEVSADMAYSSNKALQAVTDTGATPLIPFKARSQPTRGGIWEKALHYFCFKREEFEKRYHLRSNVETTFSMVKAKFGDSVRSKTEVAMKNEVLCKLVCHNICCLIQSMHEFGIDPAFRCQLNY
jgi:transposase